MQNAVTMLRAHCIDSIDGVTVTQGKWDEVFSFANLIGPKFEA